jgi:hypothetical protein
MDLDRTALHAPAKCPKKLAQRSLRLNARDGRRSKAKRSCRLPLQGSPRCLQLDWRTSVLHKRHGGHSGSVSTKSGHDSDSAERWSKFTFDEPRGTNPCRSHCESLPGVPQTDALPGTEMSEEPFRQVAVWLLIQFASLFGAVPLAQKSRWTSATGFKHEIRRLWSRFQVHRCMHPRSPASQLVSTRQLPSAGPLRSVPSSLTS